MSGNTFPIDERDIKFEELADAQRGEPERIMVKIQMSPLGAGIAPKVLEHVGDLTHRMSERFSSFRGQYGNVKDKVDKTLFWLTGYDFEDEFNRNMKNNYTYLAKEDPARLKGRTFEEEKQEFFKLWDMYASAHAKLKVYNQPQRWARDAAVAAGKRDFNTTVENLNRLKKIIDAGRDFYEQAVGEFSMEKSASGQMTITAKSATQRPPKDLELIASHDWHECGDEVDEGDWNMLVVYAKLEGKQVGWAEFIIKDGYLLPNNVEVNPEFRRKGIASAMYVFAEQETGLKARPHNIQSPEGHALWNQKDRKFGARNRRYPFLYHGTDGDNLQSIMEKGLDPKYSDSHNEWPYAIYLTDRPDVAKQYEAHDRPSRGGWVVLQIDASKLNQNELVPDDYDFIDQWASMSDEEKGQYAGQRWIDVPWYVSMEFSNQCAYLDKIPPDAIKVHSRGGEMTPASRKQANPIPTLQETLQWGGSLDLSEVTDWTEVEKECIHRAGGKEAWSALTDSAREEWENEVGKEVLHRQWNATVQRLQSFQFPLTVYRALNESLGTVNLDHEYYDNSLPVGTADSNYRNGKGVGIYWSDSEDSSYIKGQVEPEAVILRGTVQENAINWVATAFCNLVADDELEVRLKSGAKVALTGWRHKNETEWKPVPEKMKVVTASSKTSGKNIGPVYHGTPYGRDIKKFKYKGGLGGALGYWFADNFDAAKWFAKDRFAGEVPQVIEAYLDIHNPYTVSQYRELVDAILACNGDTQEDKAKAFRRQLIRQGYDGILVKECTSDSGIKRSDWVAFNPQQIEIVKSTPVENSKTASGTDGDKYSPVVHDVTENPNFKMWFRNSKIVDEQGNPLRVYHGTVGDFDTFLGENFFTADPEYAGWFAGTNEGEGRQAPLGKTMPCYLRIENPFDARKLPKTLSDTEFSRAVGITNVFSDAAKALAELRKVPMGRPQTFWKWLRQNTHDTIQALKRKGYDGIIQYEENRGKTTTAYVTFSSNQVKSAIGNNGDFNANKDNITAAKTAFINNELINLKHYLTMPAEQMGEELARSYPDQFIDFLKEKGFRPKALPKKQPVQRELPTALPPKEGDKDGWKVLPDGDGVALWNGYGSIVAKGKDEAELLKNWQEVVAKAYQRADAERAQRQRGGVMAAFSEALSNEEDGAWEQVRKYCKEFLDEMGPEFMQEDAANCPSFLHMSYEGIVKNQWLIHKTNDPEGICSSGFTIGMHDLSRLGLTTYFKDSGKMGGYNFAFLASDAGRYADNDRYGKHAVMFRASGIKVYHYADEEYQIIFKGSDAHDIIPIYNGDYGWQLPEDDHDKPVFTSERLSDIVKWVEAHYAQYRKVIVKRASLSNDKVYDVTETPQFKAWFGDSEVVDKNGKPKVMYHGTSADFNAFNSGHHLIFFSEDPKFASMYSGSEKWDEATKNVVPSANPATGANVIPVYLKCEQLFDFREPYAAGVAEEFFDAGYMDDWDFNRACADYYEKLEEELTEGEKASYNAIDFGKQVASGSWVALELGCFVDYLQRHGYDGIVLTELGAINIAVFNPNQVKSAIGNREFNPKDNRITAAHKTPTEGQIDDDVDYTPETNARALQASADVPSFEETLEQLRDEHDIDPSEVEGSEDVYAEITTRLSQNPTIYRAVRLHDVDDVRSESMGDDGWEGDDSGFGRCWAWELRGAYPYNAHMNDGRKIYIFRGRVNLSAIDWAFTLYNNVKNPHEFEVTLRQGAAVTITGWKLDTGWGNVQENQWQAPKPSFKTVYASIRMSPFTVDIPQGEAKGALVSDPKSLEQEFINHYGVTEQVADELIRDFGNLKVAILRNIDIDPKFQGEGYGTKLLAKFERKAKSLGAQVIVLMAYPDGGLEPDELYEWYSRHGYEKLDDVMQNDPIFVKSIRRAKTASSKEFFHVSWKKNRKGILAKGLVPQVKEFPELERKPGVYLLATLEQAEDWALYFGNTYGKTAELDIWSVTVPEGAELHPDKTDMDDVYNSFVVYDAIPPQNLNVVKTIEPKYYKDLSWYTPPMFKSEKKLASDDDFYEDDEFEGEDWDEDDGGYNWMHGHCHIYTVALHELTGYPCYLINDIGDDGGVAIHSVVKAPNGKFLDASGYTTLPAMKKLYGLQKPVAEPVPVKTVALMCAADDSEIEDAKLVAEEQLEKLGTRKTAASDPYLYHVTMKQNIPDIREAGLVAGARDGMSMDGMPLANYLGDKEGVEFWIGFCDDYAKSLESDEDTRTEQGLVPVVLRIPRSGLHLKKDEVGSEDAGAPAYITYDTIPPSKIQVQTDSGWEPITTSKTASTGSVTAATMTAPTSISNGFPSFDEWVKHYGGIKQLIQDYDWHIGEWFANEVDEDEFEVDDINLSEEEIENLPEAEKEKYRRKWLEDQCLELAEDHLRDSYNEIVWEHRHRGESFDVYRTISLESLRDLKTKGIGIYWSWDESKAEAHWGNGGTQYTLRARVNDADVDWNRTLYANLDPSLGEEEAEITLKEGIPVKITGWVEGRARYNPQWQKPLAEWKSATAAEE